MTTIQQPHETQLSQVLFHAQAQKFSTLSILPSNVSAMDAALEFVRGYSPFTVLIGPSGWGKTHMLQSVAERLTTKSSRVTALSAIEWLSTGVTSDAAGPLLLDDVLDISIRPRLRVQLRFALERRLKSGRRTMLCLTASKRTRQINQTLPSAQCWNFGCITVPQPQERKLFVDQAAAREGLSLSSALVHVLASQTKWTGATVVGALNRLRLMGSMWNDVSGTLKACAIMEPFFADSGSWDFPRHIVQTARMFPSEKYSVKKDDLLAFTMLKEAGLSEELTARTLKVGPGEAYRRAQAFEKAYRNDDSAALAVRQFVETIISGLVKD
jgi:chromosomal replication initiation ATPase DnaA